MKKISISLVIGLLTILPFSFMHSRFSPDRFDDFFDVIHEEMSKSFESFFTQENKDQASSLSLQIEDKHDENHITAIISGINADEADDIKANTEYDYDEKPIRLFVKTSDKSISIDYTPLHRLLSVTAQYEKKEEKKEDESVNRIMKTSSTRTLYENLKLDQAKITYDKEKKALIITIPKVERKTKKVIPVTVK